MRGRVTEFIRPFNGSDEGDVIDLSDQSGPIGIRINGGDGNDRIIGSSFADRINAGDGDDTVEGGAGDDRIFGNEGTDTAVFSGSVTDYTISEGKGNSVIVEGPDGTDELKHFEFLQFDDFTIDLSAYVIDGNNAPLVNPVSATVGEDPSSYAADTELSVDIGNLGDFYLFDADIGEMIVVDRTAQSDLLTEADSIADANGVENGVIVLAESNNGPNVTVRAYSVIDGDTVEVSSPVFTVSDFAGTSAIDSGSGQDVLQADGVDDSFGIEVEIGGVAFTDGSTGDFLFTLEGAATASPDGFTAESASYQAVIDGPSPEVTIAPDAVDLEGDVIVFSFDDTGTLGSVEYDALTETFIYSADGAFEYLADGETATDSFTYTATDEHGLSATETVTITIEGSDELAFV